MPLHTQSITEKDTMDAINSIMQKLEKCKSVWKKEDGKYVLFKENITDIKDGSKIGECIYTLGANEDGYTLLDLDLTVKSPKNIMLKFKELLKGSSDANEYYNVEYDGTVFQVETVNRHMVTEKDLTTKKHNVNLGKKK